MDGTRALGPPSAQPLRAASPCRVAPPPRDLRPPPKVLSWLGRRGARPDARQRTPFDPIPWDFPAEGLPEELRHRHFPPEPPGGRCELPAELRAIWGAEIARQ